MTLLEHNNKWLEQDALTVAPLLIGCQITTNISHSLTAGIIVETEAYLGEKDPASHAFKGLSQRTAPMFEAGGAIYVYTSYGLHACFNIVTGPTGNAQAVLIRAIEPTIGIDIMRERRKVQSQRLIGSGPGRLAQALGITTSLSGARLGQAIQLSNPTSPAQTVAVSTRIGITKAIDRPWRFYMPGNPYVSRGATA